MRNLARVAVHLATAALLLMPLVAIAQTQDPIIGTWNENGASSDGSNPFIAVMSFNAGGTTVEFDTAGSNSSASPGESIDLGSWSKTGENRYTFKDQNYIYDSSGNLANLAIAVCNVTLAANLKTFEGPCEFSFYTCSVTLCPGSLVAGPQPAKISGKRF
jgi:hypothetical protein